MAVNDTKIQKLIELVSLTAIVVVLQVFGNTITIGDLPLSLNILPVVTGAVLLGPWGGAWLGFVFGAILMFGTATSDFVVISPALAFISTAVRGALAGYISGLVYVAVAKKHEDLGIVLASVVAPVVNACVFVLCGLVFFYDYFASIMGQSSVFKGLIDSYVGINFLIELTLSMALTPVLVRFVKNLEDPSTTKDTKKTKTRHRLATHLTVGAVVLGILVCVASSYNSYENLKSTLENQYNETSQEIAEASRTYDDEELLEMYKTELEEEIVSNIINSIIMMICIEIIFIMLYFYFVKYHIIEPVNNISREVSRFVENENEACDSIPGIKTQDEIQQLSKDIVKMEHDISNYIENITVITAEKERIATELNVAKKIQADMLPSKFPAFPERTEFDIFASMVPAEKVGGDFYDFFLIDDDHLALVIADVSDKGVPAALFMVIAKTLIKNQTLFSRSPQKIIDAVNKQLCANNDLKMFVTVWLCIYEISTGKCIATNAGHEYPAIRKTSGDFELLRDKHNFVVGGFDQAVYSEYEFQIEKGGTLFVYTDGVAEATSAKDEYFGTDRMLDALNLDAQASPDILVKNVKEAVEDFVAEAPQSDDTTMLCLKRL